MKLRWDHDPATGCWNWTGSTYRGYGRTHYQGSKMGAYRAVWIATRGPIPAGMELDHLCRNRLCVNPDHLELVTHRENLLRARPGGPDHCMYGHAMTPENTMIRSNGSRRCRVCHRINSQRTRDRARAAGASVASA